MKFETIAVADLSLDPSNVRKHSRRNLDAIKASLRKFGQQKPIVVDAKGIVLAGNGALTAAKELGWTEIQIVRTDLEGVEATAFAIADNRTAELAEWEDNLDEVLKSLLGAGQDLEDLGFSESELAKISSDLVGDAGLDAEPQVDKSDELRVKWGVESGQLWQLGDHRLLCGDSAKVEDARRVMAGGLADMVITDPPYGVAYVGKTKDALKVENDDVDEETLAKMCKQWFDAADEVSRAGAYWIATVPAGPLHGVFFNDWKARGYLRQVMVWNKDSMVMGHSEYHYKHEPILFGWKPGDRLKNSDRTKTTVWDFARPKASREHPTMKPVEMWAYAIGNHTERGNCVYERFSGSGTTIMACEQLGRKARAIEISPNYVAVALQRWADATNQTPSNL
jgi:site-specific DNA-methyltransferase (adenine-specific)